MNDRLQPFPGTADIGLAGAQRNTVLRNTYWLLALSLVPTVLGAWVGVSTGIVASMGMGLSLVVFLAGAFGLMYAIEKTKNSATGVYVLLGFTFFMGLMLSRMVGQVLGLRNGASLVMTAFGGTSLIFFTMATLATTIKRDLSGMGTARGNPAQAVGAQGSRRDRETGDMRACPVRDRRRAGAGPAAPA